MPAIVCLPVPQGVGSHAAHLLLRSGVGRLRLIDFDQLTLSSLNRHCLATRADVGIPKAACLARHFAGEAGTLLLGQVPVVADVVCLLLA
jgi:tRNA A37 threonylcarbamoyladenosine dehydratase